MSALRNSVPFCAFALALCGVPLTAISAAAAPTQAAPAKRVLADTDKERDIRYLIHMTGVDKLALQAMDQMLTSFQKEQPNVPAEFWTRFRSKISSGELIDRLVPLYDRYYTKADVKGLIRFYSSPLGQKVTRVAPDLMRDSYGVGAAWGREKGEEVVRELNASQGSDSSVPSPPKPPPGNDAGTATTPK